MGRKFIDKKNSQKFHLLHRSQTDIAHAREGVPSEFVLVAVSKVIFFIKYNFSIVVIVLSFFCCRIQQG
jgi:hypothetical protein